MRTLNNLLGEIDGTVQLTPRELTLIASALRLAGNEIEDLTDEESIFAFTLAERLDAVRDASIINA